MRDAYAAFISGQIVVAGMSRADSFTFHYDAACLMPPGARR